MKLITIDTILEEGAPEKVIGKRRFFLHDLVQVFSDSECYIGPYFAQLKGQPCFRVSKEDFAVLWEELEKPQ